MFITLSHSLSESTPFYDGLRPPTLERLYDLAKGDACNSFYLTTSNHAGTHVDAPYHFNPQGRRIAEYSLSELIFTRPAVIDIQAAEEQLILPSHLDACAACRDNCDILLLRSGFGKHRGNAATYVNRAPGFSAAAAEFIMRRFPNLKALAVDFVSVASMAHMDEGCQAHRVFLGCGEFAHRPILLIEDALLPATLAVPQRVFVIPWFVEALDSAPCTLFAEFQNE